MSGSPRSPEKLSRAVFDAVRAENVDALLELVHPDADFQMAMAPDRIISGQDDVMATLKEAWKRVHRIRADRFYELSDEAVIVEGRSQHSIPDRSGIRDSPVVWLHVYRDEMLWRVRLYPSVEAAREAWTELDGDGVASS